MTQPNGKNKTRGIVSPLEMKTGMSPETRAVPAAMFPGQLISGDQAYMTTTTVVQLPFSPLLFAFTSALQPATQFPVCTVHVPRKTTLIDPACCPCPCLVRASRPGHLGSHWLHTDGLPSWGKFHL